MSKKSNVLAGMGTTLCCLYWTPEAVVYAHIGDSRAWRLSGERLTCLTTDHVRPEPDLSHVLIRALGIEEEARLDHATFELAERDRLLLTSDGELGTEI